MAITAAALWLALGTLARADLVGVASVIDGDTIEIHGQRIRLHGIDARESSQTCHDGAGRQWRCGQRAAIALQDLIGRRTVTCHERDFDRYGRVVAQCFVGETDINAGLVGQGWALAYRRYSRDYVAAEDAARAAGRGMWAGTFEPPWTWPPTPSAMLNKLTLALCAIHTVKNEQGILGPRNDIGLFGPMTYSGQFCTIASIPPVSSHVTDG